MRPLITSLLDVLHLLAQALDARLELDHPVRDLRVVALRADRVGLAPHFLEQEVELAPDRLLGSGICQDFSELIDVAL